MNTILSINSNNEIDGQEISVLSTPLEFLESIFPSYSKEEIYKVLVINHYDLYQTLDDLMEKDDDYEYDYDENGNVVDRLVLSSNGGNNDKNTNINQQQQIIDTNTTPICKYYVNGVCSNNNCPFLHTTTDGKAPTIAPTCKFFLNEGCFITNCPYRHSSETLLCKFWMIGSCTKGNDCIYSHQLTNTIELYNDQSKKTSPMSNKSTPFIPNTSNNNNNSNNKQYVIPKSDSFPSLSSSNSKSPKPILNNIHSKQKKSKSKPISQPQKEQKEQPIITNSPPIISKVNSNTNLNNIKPKITKAIEDHETFPTLSSAKTIPKKKKHNNTQLQNNFDQSNDMSYIVKIKQLEESFRHVSLDDIKREFSQSNDVNQTTISLTEKYGAPRIITQPQSNNNSQQPKRLQTPTPKGNISWVGTGSELNNLYSKHRDEAIQHGRERNLCFNLAAKAFLAGDPASAKRLSEKGHYHDRIMKELHAKAMDLIFQERNMNFESDTLDLHGLHVKEAIQILEDRLDYNQLSSPLYIIVGVGHHSIGHQARLPLKVKEYIANRGFRYKDCSHDRREGLIMVYK